LGGIDGAASEGGPIIDGATIKLIAASPGVSGGKTGFPFGADGAGGAGSFSQSPPLALHLTITWAW
jgi:hypothetical protein